MKLIDLLPLEKWVKIEQKVNQMSGLDTNVFNIDGFRITDHKKWANRLCPAIKATDKGQSYICAVAHMNLAILAQNTQKPVMEECDAGLLKIVVPIFVNNEFLGAFGACGLLLDDGEVDAFLVNKTTGIDEDDVESLSQDIGGITSAKAQAVIDFIEAQIEEIVANYERQ
jgi:ligand-binding sensor protein